MKKGSKQKLSGRERDEHWLATRRPLDDTSPHDEQLMAIIRDVRSAGKLTADGFNRIVRRHPYAGKYTFNKKQLVAAYHRFCADGRLPFEREILRRLQRKPTRTISGVAPVAVLTKPYPCPGECIFCPTVDGQPKSYLPDEPGAARAASLHFDPYTQTAVRISTFEGLGHSTDKVELLILGGSWSAYPTAYQEWFVRRCLEAMNDQEADSLLDAQLANEKAQHRNVGLVIETRPDMITAAEIGRLRRLGVTKVQLGAQSLDDRILELNKRGHTAAQTRSAIRLLRLAGIKIAVHWMPNLLGATPESDLVEFARWWDDPSLRPDEMKIYPTALLQGTDLYHLWQAKEYAPYPEPDLIDLVAACKTLIQPYCRINRIMRDIPAGNIVEGSTKSNLRQIVQQRMDKQGERCSCIRCSEVRSGQVERDELYLDDLSYRTDATEERLFRFLTPNNKLAGYLRLSLPDFSVTPVMAELKDHAVIREVHVYGPALAISSTSEGEAQHIGLGEQLIRQAIRIARSAGYGRIAVIAAVGTRDYYRKYGFQLGELYMSRRVEPD